MSGILSKTSLCIVYNGEKVYIPMYTTKDYFTDKIGSIPLAIFCTTVNGRRLYIPLAAPRETGTILCTKIGSYTYSFIKIKYFDKLNLHVELSQKTESVGRNEYVYTYVTISVGGVSLGLNYEITISASDGWQSYEYTYNRDTDVPTFKVDSWEKGTASQDVTITFSLNISNETKKIVFNPDNISTNLYDFYFSLYE